MYNDKGNFQIDELTYESLLQLIIQEMHQLVVNINSSCESLQQMHAMLGGFKQKIKSENDTDSEIKKNINMQIQDVQRKLQKYSESMEADLDKLRFQLDAYRTIFHLLADSGLTSGDIDSTIRFVEDALDRPAGKDKVDDGE